ncbi:helix-turn-helix domain-containing protein [Sporosalibacterium faouarense]|uniref:helix-turn-helix domain-containing protein n=1 Tax=Sporosalibacterium faouarense TaxID=516123 RepID=UPI00192C9FF6|nr:helix-turn-helix transcriptional regulator [Sporosalibacterium faouarense]
MKILLKEIRLQCGFTQLQLSRMSGISKSYISLVENGERQPTLYVLCRLSKALGVELIELVECD